MARPSRRGTGRRRAALYGILALADAALAGSRDPGRRRLRAATKPLLMPVLASSYAARTGGGADPALRSSVLTAHALSWSGDVALLGEGEARFLAGVGSFAGAHLAYLRAFGRRGVAAGSPGARRPLVVAAGIGAVAAPAMARAASRTSPALAAPVAGYVALLVSMGAAAFRLDADRGTRRTVAVGASLFLLSDTVIGLREFWWEEPGPRSDAVVMATYTAGQALIALGLARLDGPITAGNRPRT